MSLSVDGVWKAGVFSQTVWADGVWRVGAVQNIVKNIYKTISFSVAMQTKNAEFTKSAPKIVRF